jgi:uncharacterized protein
MAEIGAVATLFRYPVKSMQGAPVTSVTFRDGYVEGDRRLGVVDPAAGKVLSAKRWPALLLASARIDGEGADGPVVITLPDGSEHEADDPGIHDVLSGWLDRDVRLCPPPEGAPLPMEMGVDPTDDDADVFDWPGPPGAWVDLAQAHWLTSASLEAARALHPDGDWDVRRFRPTGLLDVDGEGFVEDSWELVQLGELRSEVFMPTVRCAMPTRAQPALGPGGPALGTDKQVARTLSDHHDSNLGVYATVTGDGTLRVGDPVGLL